MALTQSQMIAAVADRAEMSRADAKRALAALDEIVLEELGNAQKVRVGGLVQLTVRVKPATEEAQGAQSGDRRGDRRLRLSPRALMFERDRWQRPRRRFRQCRRRGGGLRRQTDAARDSARSPRSAAERQARQTSLAWTSPANAQLRRNRAACPTPAPPFPANDSSNPSSPFPANDSGREASAADLFFLRSVAVQQVW